MKMHNPLCLQKGEDLYVRYYETPEPKQDEDLDGQVEGLYDAVRHNRWLASAKEVKVREEDKKSVLDLIFRECIEAWAFDMEDFYRALRAGIDVTPIIHRIEIVEPDKSDIDDTMFEPFATLKPEQKQTFTREDMIGFAEWINEEGWIKNPTTDSWHKIDDMMLSESPKEKTTEQLLDIYTKNK